RLGRVRAVPRVPDRAPHDRLHDQRHREPQRPVPKGGPTSRSLPQRASLDEDPLPFRPPTTAGAVEPDRQDQRLETHPERTHHPLRRPHRRQPIMTITTRYTKNRTVPGDELAGAVADQEPDRPLVVHGEVPG